MAVKDAVPMPAGIDVDDDELLAELQERQAAVPQDAPQDGRVSHGGVPWKRQEAQKQ